MSYLIFALSIAFKPHSYVEFLTIDFFLYWQIKPAITIAIANNADSRIKTDKQTSSFTFKIPSKNILLEKFLI